MQTYELRNCLKQQLSQKLDILQKNQEAVPEELLKTKYKAAYDKLLRQIETYVSGLFCHIFLLISVREEAMAEMEEMREKFGELIYQNHDINGAEDLAFNFAETKFCEGKAVLRFVETEDEALLCSKLERLVALNQ